MTPLHYAALVGNQQIVGVLLNYGADKTIVDNEGNSPSDLASETGIQSQLTIWNKSIGIGLAEWHHTTKGLLLLTMPWKLRDGNLGRDKKVGSGVIPASVMFQSPSWCSVQHCVRYNGVSFWFSFAFPFARFPSYFDTPTSTNFPYYGVRSGESCFSFTDEVQTFLQRGQWIPSVIQVMNGSRWCNEFDRQYVETILSRGESCDNNRPKPAAAKQLIFS